MKSTDRTIKVSFKIYQLIRRIKDETGLPIKQIAKKAVELLDTAEKKK